MVQEGHGEQEEKDRTEPCGGVSKGVQRKGTHRKPQRGRRETARKQLRESQHRSCDVVGVAPALGKNQLEQVGCGVETRAGLGSSGKEVQWLAFSAQTFEGRQSPDEQSCLGLELSLE